MTRINLVDPSVLTDKHLSGEYTEITRISANVLQCQEKGKKPSDINIPSKFVLGEGHMKFFYDKCRWLRKRYKELYDESMRRGVKLDWELYKKYNSRYDSINDEWYNDWQPSPEDIYLSMARLCKMSKLPEVIDELTS